MSEIAETPNCAEEDAAIRGLAERIVDISDEDFASRIVGLLILDKGSLNAYQRTIETMLKIHKVKLSLQAKTAS